MHVITRACDIGERLIGHVIEPQLHYMFDYHHHFGALGGAGATFAVELFGALLGLGATFAVSDTAPEGANFLRRAPPHRYAAPAANPPATIAIHE